MSGFRVSGSGYGKVYEGGNIHARDSEGRRVPFMRLRVLRSTKLELTAGSKEGRVSLELHLRGGGRGCARVPAASSSCSRWVFSLTPLPIGWA